MPQIKQMTQEQLQQLERQQSYLFSNRKKEFSEEDLANIIVMLQGAADVYLSKFGTYKSGYYRQFNENKVRSSFKIINSLLSSYNEYENLTEAQIKLAKRLIRNASRLV